MPEPQSPAFVDRAAEEVVRLLEMSRGRAFVLFTSYANMNAVAERVAGRIDYPMLIQGEAPRAALVETFRTTPGAVLFATASFWQGVDVAGEQLSCVIIDKLPFASPGDPVVAARIDRLRNRGVVRARILAQHVKHHEAGFVAEHAHAGRTTAARSLDEQVNHHMAQNPLDLEIVLEQLPKQPSARLVTPPSSTTVIWKGPTSETMEVPITPANVAQVDTLYKAILEGENLDPATLFKLQKLYKGASIAAANAVI
jgi:hypothetical protein